MMRVAGVGTSDSGKESQAIDSEAKTADLWETWYSI